MPADVSFNSTVLPMIPAALFRKISLILASVATNVLERTETTIFIMSDFTEICFPARVQANVFVPIEDSVSSFPTLIAFFTDHLLQFITRQWL